MEVIEHIKALLTAKFHDSKVELDAVKPPPKVSGVLITDQFAGIPQRERQRQLWEALKNGLPTDEQQLITAIITLTPAEYSNILAGEYV